METRMCRCPYHTDQHGHGTVLPLSAFRLKWDGTYSRYCRKGTLLLLWDRYRIWETQRAEHQAGQ